MFLLSPALPSKKPTQKPSYKKTRGGNKHMGARLATYTFMNTGVRRRGGGSCPTGLRTICCNVHYTTTTTTYSGTMRLSGGSLHGGSLQHDDFNGNSQGRRHGSARQRTLAPMHAARRSDLRAVFPLFLHDDSHKRNNVLGEV